MLKTIFKLLVNFVVCWISTALVATTMSFFLEQIRLRFKTASRWPNQYDNDWIEDWKPRLSTFFIICVAYFFFGLTTKYFLKTRLHALLLGLILISIAFTVLFLPYTYNRPVHIPALHMYFIAEASFGAIFISLWQNIKKITADANGDLE